MENGNVMVSWDCGDDTLKRRLMEYSRTHILEAIESGKTRGVMVRRYRVEGEIQEFNGSWEIV